MPSVSLGRRSEMPAVYTFNQVPSAGKQAYRHAWSLGHPCLAAHYETLTSSPASRRRSNSAALSSISWTWSEPCAREIICRRVDVKTIRKNN